MSETESLASILVPANTQAPVATPEPVESAPETKAEAAPAEKADGSRDDKGRFAKPEPTAEAPKEQKQERMVPLSALLAERAKARNVEPPKAEPKVSVFDDEDRGISQRVDERVSPLKEQVAQMRYQFFEITRDMLRTHHTDYDEAEKSFTEAAQADPALLDQLAGHRNPAQFIYEAGKLRKELEAAGGDITKIGEVQSSKVREELKTVQEQNKALAAELETLKAQMQNVSNIPTSLNRTASATPASRAEADDDSIKSLVRFGNNRR